MTEEITPVDKLAELVGRLEQKLAQPGPVKEPAPAEEDVEEQKPPQAPTGRITQEDYAQLATYAATQSQKALRLELAKQYGLEEKELAGTFSSPEAMRQFAEITSMKKQVAALKEDMAKRQAEPASHEEAEPQADTGGPTGEKRDASLQDEIDAVKKGGRSQENRRHLLDLIYKDPTRILRRQD